MKFPTHMSAGRDYSHPLHGRYEYVLFAADETVVARGSGFKSKVTALSAGRRKAAAITDILECELARRDAMQEKLRDQIANEGDC